MVGINRLTLCEQETTIDIGGVGGKNHPRFNLADRNKGHVLPLRAQIIEVLFFANIPFYYRAQTRQTLAVPASTATRITISRLSLEIRPDMVIV
ncbi:hypothetical protein JCM12296A_32860 [Desulfosarcina cetonica]